MLSMQPPASSNGSELLGSIKAEPSKGPENSRRRDGSDCLREAKMRLSSAVPIRVDRSLRIAVLPVRLEHAGTHSPCSRCRPARLRVRTQLCGHGDVDVRAVLVPDPVE